MYCYFRNIPRLEIRGKKGKCVESSERRGSKECTQEREGDREQREREDACPRDE